MYNAKANIYVEDGTLKEELLNALDSVFYAQEILKVYAADNCFLITEFDGIGVTRWHCSDMKCFMSAETFKEKFELLVICWL